LQAQKIDSRITVNDVLPTLAEAVGFKDFNTANLDGANQWDFLSGQTNQAIPTSYIIHGTGNEAYYKGNWKLVVPSFPRGKPVDDPMWQTFMDMDKFGGEENREPYGGLEGVNAGPLHPIYYMVPLFLLSIIGLIWWWRMN